MQLIIRQIAWNTWLGYIEFSDTKIYAEIGEFEFVHDRLKSKYNELSIMQG